MSGLPFYLPSTLPGDGDTDAGNEDSPTGGADGTLAEVTGGLCAEGQDLLISQYAESTRLKAMLCALVDPCQDFDAAAVGIYERGTSLDAEGVSLDTIGKLVGEARDGRVDYVYRRALRVRILINLSQGRLPDIVRIVRTFEEMDSDPDAYVRVRHVQPARMEVRVIHTPVNIPREIHTRLRQAKAATGALTTMTVPYPATRARAFRLCRSADYPEKNTTEGFCSVLDRSTGGYLLHGMTGALPG